MRKLFDAENENENENYLSYSLFFLFFLHLPIPLFSLPFFQTSPIFRIFLATSFFLFLFL